MCVASLCLSLATGCSVYNGFIKVGQSAIHGTLSSIGISGDKGLSYMIDNYGDRLYGVPYAKINTALDNRLTLGTRKMNPMLRAWEFCLSTIFLTRTAIWLCNLIRMITLTCSP